MGRWDSDEDDWRGWKDGKYDNRYSNNRRRKSGKNRYKKNKGEKKGIGILLVGVMMLVGFLFFFGVFEFNQKNLDETFQQISHSLQAVGKFIQDFATETSTVLQETENEQTESTQETRKIVDDTEDKIPKIPLPELEIPKYQPPKEYNLEELKQIALDDINKYRKENGLRSIILGMAKSPQLYASELLPEGCIHHISDRGEGPMLRYKNNNDKMYLISENIGGGLGTSWETPDESIINSNYRMMYDDADSNWGHRDNILDPNHQSVSIGIAYDNARLVMVQDFEQSLQHGWQYDPSSFQKEPLDQRLCW